MQQQQAQQQSPALAQRIVDKRQELENLKELRDLSAALAQQMEQLEQKLSTLADGTEGTSCYMLCYLFKGSELTLSTTLS